MAKEKTVVTKQELETEMRKLKERMQNEFIDGLLEKVDLLLEKAVRADYEPTEHEREQFGKIVTIVRNMNKWF